MIRSLARWLLVAAGSALFGIVLIAAGLYAYFLRGGPAPSPWHVVTLDDFTAERAAEIATLDDYLRLEDRLFSDLRQRIYAVTDAGDASPFNRYTTGSRSDPGRWPVDWNRSFRRLPEPGTSDRGAVLLLHGLTDSPYSLRTIADHLAAQGFEVFALRLPGHGTAPSGLLTFTIEDMQAAVRLAVRDLASRGAPGRPIYLVGYSNGGALAVDYTLAVLEGEPLPKPAGLVLISPALGVSSLAIVGRIKTGLSYVPGFERAAWQTLLLEFDPFKYSSFSFHAAGETYRLTRRVARGLERLSAGGAVEAFPPVLVFLSTVDSTVHADAVTEVLLDRLAPRGHELVLFDVNRYSAVQALLVDDPGPLTQALLDRVQRPYGLTVITNASQDTLEVQEIRAPAGASRRSMRRLDLEWPPNVFSVSHVALSFAPDDPLYGYAAPAGTGHVQLGRIEIRGENGVLKVPMWALTRQRSNPFHGYLLERLDEFLATGAAAR